MIPVMKTLHQQPPRPTRCVSQLSRFHCIRGQRFFAQNILAGSERFERPLSMEAVGQRVINQVDIVVVNHR